MEHTKSINDEPKIRISGLSIGLHEYHFTVEAVSLGLNENFRKPVEINSTLEKTARQIYLKTIIKTSGHFQCDRCLDEFDQAVSTQYNMYYIFDELEAGKYPTDEVQIISTATMYLDLAEDVRQAVNFAIPLKLLCTEKCRGLCPHCGNNCNHQSCDCKEEVTDPRWNSLKNIIEN